MKLSNYDDEIHTLRMHLKLIHGMYVGDVKTLTGLREAHADSHDDPDAHFVLEHTHDAGWYCEEGVEGMVQGRLDVRDDPAPEVLDFAEDYFT